MKSQSRRSFVSGAVSGLSMGVAGMARADHSNNGCHATSHTYQVAGWKMVVNAENFAQHGAPSDNIYQFTITHLESNIQFVFHTGTTQKLQVNAANKGVYVMNVVENLASVDWFVGYAKNNLPLPVMISFINNQSGETRELNGQIAQSHNGHASGLGFTRAFDNSRMSEALWFVAGSNTAQIQTDIEANGQRHWVSRYDVNPLGMRELLEVSKALTKKIIYLPPLDASACNAAATNDADLEDQIEDLIIEEVLGDCFLTTACCDMLARPDTCVELQSLRSFRDDWLSKQPYGKAMIAEYYHVAPKICSAIAADKWRKLELLRIYAGTILPCVALSRVGAKLMTHRLYCRLVRRLSRKYAIV